MTCPYLPVVRTFCRLRAELLRHLDVDRAAIRPSTLLVDLLPLARRREIWREMRQRGFDVPDLSLSPRDAMASTFVACKTAASIALAVQSWYALLTIVPIAALIFRANRHRSVHLAPCVSTVGELVVYLTSFRPGDHPGYRWSRHEIATKVRLVVADWAGVTLDEVHEDTNVGELLG